MLAAANQVRLMGRSNWQKKRPGFYISGVQVSLKGRPIYWRGPPHAVHLLSIGVIRFLRAGWGVLNLGVVRGYHPPSPAEWIQC